VPDTYDAAVRSRVMRQVKSQDTMPEVLLRKALRAQGIVGYRLHRKDIAGNPDLVFTRWRVAVFVDGGWWHGHPNKWWKGRSGDYWDAKIQRNIDRDRRIDATLAEQGWAVVRLWDFEVAKTPEAAVEKIRSALTNSR
jgi:DNA mismatch endonuclease, patch repair protein